MRLRRIGATALLLGALATPALALERRVEEYTPTAQHELVCDHDTSGTLGAIRVPEGEEENVAAQLGEYLAARASVEPISWAIDPVRAGAPVHFTVSTDGTFSCKPLEGLLPSAVTSVQEKAVSNNADRNYLNGLLNRTTVTTPGTNNPTNVTYLFGDEFGGVIGIATIGQSTRNNIYDNNPETHFFYTIKQEGNTITVSRDDRNTYFVNSGDQYVINACVSNVCVSNVLGSSHTASGTTDVTWTGSGVRTKEDLSTYMALASSGRTRWCDNLAGVGGGTVCYNTGMIVYGTANPYHVDINAKTSNGTSVGLMAVDITANRDSQNKLANSTMAVDQTRTNADPIQMRFYTTHPQPPNQMWTFLDSGYNLLGPTDPSTIVFFPDLLGDTALNTPP